MEATVILAVAFGVAIAGALVAGVLADRKGYSAVAFVLLGLCAWPVAIIVAVVLPSKSTTVAVGDIVRVRRPVTLTAGNAIPSGHVSKVHAIDVIDGTATVQIKAPDGSERWIAKANVVPE